MTNQEKATIISNKLNQFSETDNSNEKNRQLINQVIDGHIDLIKSMSENFCKLDKKQQNHVAEGISHLIPEKIKSIDDLIKEINREIAISKTLDLFAYDVYAVETHNDDSFTISNSKGLFTYYVNDILI